jgi:hypothetical protein
MYPWRKWWDVLTIRFATPRLQPAALFAMLQRKERVMPSSANSGLLGAIRNRAAVPLPMPTVSFAILRAILHRRRDQLRTMRMAT